MALTHLLISQCMTCKNEYDWKAIEDGIQVKLTYDFADRVHPNFELPFGYSHGFCVSCYKITAKDNNTHPDRIEKNVYMFFHGLER